MSRIWAFFWLNFAAVFAATLILAVKWHWC